MRIIFTAINAKYIHTNPAIRLLTKVSKDKFNSSFVEFTIKDKIENIISYLKEYDVVGLSCYIWNIDMMIEISKKLKEINNNIIVFAGGPEVGYDTASFINYFDYIMSGEGEGIIIPFLEKLENKEEINIPGIATKQKPNAIPQYVKDLSKVPDILDMYTEDDYKNRIIYVETSRGCPFKCSYCLSSVEPGVRFFPKEHTDKVFNFIINHEFKCIKFLDRTFNVNPKRFIEICKVLEKTRNTYQFEVEPSIINEQVIKYLTNEVTPNKFRLEIGIQSLLDKAIKEVDRIQNAPSLLKTIKAINEANRVTIHVDLIAGLPYEDLDSFKNTFNQTFLLLCEELQLGFLKLLRGTKLRNTSSLYEYKFMPCSPYEVLSNKFINEEEMKIIHDCETSLEWIWNHKRAYNFMKKIIKDNIITNYFDFFAGFAKYYDKKKQLHENYKALIEYLSLLNINSSKYLDELKLDYLTKVKIKPLRFWGKEEYSHQELIEKVLELSLDFKKVELLNSFITTYKKGFIIITYNDGKPKLNII